MMRSLGVQMYPLHIVLKDVMSVGANNAILLYKGGVMRGLQNATGAQFKA